MLRHVLMQLIELGRQHGRVVVPPDRRFGQRIKDNELVLGGTSRMLAGRYGNWTGAQRGPFTALDDQLKKLGLVEILMDFCEARQSATGYCMIPAGAVRLLHFVIPYPGTLLENQQCRNGSFERLAASKIFGHRSIG